LPSGKTGNRLEVIAEAEHKGEKFVEMYKIRGKEHYGVQFHPEKGKGEVIKNLFNRAAKKKRIPSYAKIGHYSRKAV